MTAKPAARLGRCRRATVAGGSAYTEEGADSGVGP